MKNKFCCILIVSLIFTGSVTGVNVDFVYKNHCINNIIYFEDQSTSENKIISWYWEFGDGSVANDNSPVHVYSESGIYKVQLTVKTESGKEYSLKKSVLINSAPFAFFNPNPNCDQTVNFKDNSFTQTAEVKQWMWDFGDGNYSMEKNPNHKFSEQVKTKVHLKVLDNNGCVDSITQVVKIKKKPQVGFDIKNVLLSNPAFIKVKSHNFKDSISYSINNKTVKYPGTLLTANIFGSSTIKQKVKNEMGCSDSSITIISPKQDFQVKLPAYFQPNVFNYTSRFGVNNSNLVVRELSIFNEKGKQVFHACNNTSWDGKDENGHSCKDGTYTYLLEYENPQNTRVIQKGKFVLKN
tara:strand:- start:2184 stop:3239 length:1056 start_codon:yes stop_codon:yes gene_type:complete